MNEKIDNNNNKILDGLNPQQKVAVVHNESSLRIIAGAGTGKTKVLMRKIMYLVERKLTTPQKILAITFTNKALDDMQTRLKRLIGMRANDVNITTFVTLGIKILREDAKYLPRHLGIKSNFVILDDENITNILKLIYRRNDLDEREISWNFAKRYILHQKLIRFFDTQLFYHNELTSEEKVSLEKIYSEYEKIKSRNNTLDLEDIEIATHKLLTHNPLIATKWANRFSHIMVDEFQDINSLQYEILVSLSGGTIVTVVGDPDQTIYTWRGADAKLFLDFDEDFENTTTIMLTENYRSTKRILEVANALISKNKLRFEKNLFTKNEEGDIVEYNHAFNADAEARWIVNKINEMKKKKIQLKNIAILYRSNFLLRALEDHLAQENINHIIYGGKKFYHQNEIKEVIWFLRLLHDTNDLALVHVINASKKIIHPRKLHEIVKKLGQGKAPNDLYKYLMQNYNKLDLPKVNRDRLFHFLRNVIKYKQILKSTNQSDSPNKVKYSFILNDFLKKIDFYKHIKKNTQDEDDPLSNVTELFNSMDKWQNAPENQHKTVRDFFDYISLFSSDSENEGGNNYISLMTAQNSKGLEFEYVFLMGLSDTVFPSWKSTRQADGFSDDENKIEEERRLAYVALTRTKKKLYLSDSRGADPTTNKQKTPSRFIAEMNINLNDHILDLGSLGINMTGENRVDSSRWVVGDICTHTVYGEGEIVEILGNYVIVAFQKHGKKSIMKNHPAIRVIP